MVFELGFFSPATFVGIWYKGIAPITVVWVANRDAPIDGTMGILSIINGGLVLSDRSSGRVLWSTSPNATGAATVAQLWTAATSRSVAPAAP
jgi:hypothetical protein